MENNKLTIATYNIQFAINSEKILDNIEKITKDGADIVCLQEIINIPKSEFIINNILKRLGNTWKAAYHVGTENSKLSIGTAIIWNSAILKLDHEEKLLLPKLNKFDLHEKFYYKVIGVPGVPLQRKAITGYFMYKQTPIRITSVHLDNVGGPLHRLKQVSYLVEKLYTTQTPQQEIICGDFNTFDLLKTGYEKKLLQRKFGKEFEDASRDVGWTSDIHMIDFQTSVKLFPWFIKTFNIHVRRRLDYIWVKNLEVLFCKKIGISGSDHLPIIAKLKIA